MTHLSADIHTIRERGGRPQSVHAYQTSTEADPQITPKRFYRNIFAEGGDCFHFSSNSFLLNRLGQYIQPVSIAWNILRFYLHYSCNRPFAHLSPENWQEKYFYSHLCQWILYESYFEETSTHPSIRPTFPTHKCVLSTNVVSFVFFFLSCPVFPRETNRN